MANFFIKTHNLVKKSHQNDKCFYKKSQPSEKRHQTVSHYIVTKKSQNFKFLLKKSLPNEKKVTNMKIVVIKSHYLVKKVAKL